MRLASVVEMVNSDVHHYRGSLYDLWRADEANRRKGPHNRPHVGKILLEVGFLNALLRESKSLKRDGGKVCVRLKSLLIPARSILPRLLMAAIQGSKPVGESCSYCRAHERNPTRGEHSCYVGHRTPKGSRGMAL